MTPQSAFVFSPSIVRNLSVFLACVGMLACLILAPVQSIIWNGPEAPQWTAVARTLASILNLNQQSHLDPVAYRFFGRFLVLGYVGALAGFSRLHVPDDRIALRLKGALLILLHIAMGADVVTYWIAGLENETLRNLSFWYAEVPALVGILAILGISGIRNLRRGRGDRVTSASNVFAIPLALIAALAIQYLPTGVLLAISVAAVTSASRAPRAAN